jgi:hypothetical protein
MGLQLLADEEPQRHVGVADVDGQQQAKSSPRSWAVPECCRLYPRSLAGL